MELIDQKQDGALVVSLNGRLDANSSGPAQERIVGWIDGGETRLVLDLSKLEYISSAGLRVLLVAAKKLKGGNGKIALYGLQSAIREIFEIAGFVGMFPILGTREEALSKVK